MRLLLLVALGGIFLAGCTFGVKTCSPTDPCLGDGQCEEGFCLSPDGGGGGDAGAAGGGGGSTGGGGGSTVGGGGGSTGGGGGSTGGGGGSTGGGGGGSVGGGGGSTGGGGGGSMGGAGGSVDAGPFDAGPLVGVVFLTPPRTVIAGVCSEVIRIGVYEDAGVNDEDGGVAPLRIDWANEDALFYEDSACTVGPQHNYPIPDSGVVGLYFVGPTTGSVLVLASHAMGLLVDQVQNVIGGPPRRLSFGSSVTVASGACSTPLQVWVRDGFGNITTVTSPLAVGLSSSASTTRFFASTDANCVSPLAPARITLSAGASVSTFRITDTTSGLPELTADAGPGSIDPAAQEQTVL